MTTFVQQAPPHAVVVPGTVQYQHAVGPLPGENLNENGAKITGWIQVSCGAISVFLGVIAIAIDACNADSATPIWCGVVLYIPAGILGVCAAKQKSQCTIVGCMVMSILAAICSVSHFSVNLSAALNQDDWECNYDSDDESAKIAVNSLLTIAAVVEFFISIYASIVMCGGTNCCCQTRPNQTVTVIQTHPGAATTTTQVVHAGYVGQGQPTGYAQPQLNPGFPQYGQQPQYQQQPMYQHPQQPPYQYQQQPPQVGSHDNPPPYAPAPDAKI